MKLRITSGVVGVAALSLLVAGCGGDDGGTSELKSDACAPITDGSAKGETLTVWIMEGTNPDSKPYFDELGKKFQEQTGATLDVQYQDWANAQTKLNNAIGGETTPDVSEIGNTWTPGFADAGALVNLDACTDSVGGTDKFADGLVESGTYDESLYGMPWYSGVRGIVYRKDVFEKAGVTPPTNWDELVSAIAKLKKAEPDMLPFPVAGDSEYGLDPFIWGAGGEIATEEDGTWTSQVDSAEAQEGIDFYTSLATEHGSSSAAATTWLETDLADAFARGDAAMIIGGNWTPGYITDANPDLEGKIAAMPIPGQDGGMAPTFLGGSNLGIFEGTENADLAWTFVQMMTTGEFAGKWSEQTGYFPGSKDLLDETVAAEDPLVTPFAEAMLEAGVPVPVTPAYEKVQGKRTLNSMLQDILSGDASVEDATADAADEMNGIFQGE